MNAKYIKKVLIFIISVLVFSSCASVENLPDERFGIYNIKEVELKCHKGDYRQIYRIYTTPNVAYYTTTYYYPTDNGWLDVGTDSDTVPDKEKRKASDSIGIKDGFDVNQKIAVKINVVAYRYKDSDFTPTESYNHIFNINKSDLICRQ